MRRSRVSHHLAVLTFGVAITTPLMGIEQQSSTVPTSDTNRQKASDIGTTYRIQNKLTDKHAILTAEFNVPLQEVDLVTTTSTSVQYPTSDRINSSQGEVLMQLTLGTKHPKLAPGQLQAHTNYAILRRNAPPSGPLVAAVVPAQVAGPEGETPESLRAVYGIPPDAGIGAIAIVDAYAYPEADNDLETFSTQFHLPSCRENKDDETKGCLQKFPQTADHKEDISGIAISCGWAGESALDLQAVHALIPKAKLIYVQARSNSYDDLFVALKIAQQALMDAGGGQISMSWGGAEFETEGQFDQKFIDGPLYFASTGDHGGDLLYPAVSPKVIAVGGTTLVRKPTGELNAQTSWDSSGGGASQFEPLPGFQLGIENIVAGKRNVPDISADANPSSGMAVYAKVPKDSCIDHPSPEQELNGWLEIGGTSLAAPLMAAMANAAGHHRTLVAKELAAIYVNRNNPNRIKDIVVETGPAGGNHVLAGFDRVTGVGTPSSISFDADVSQPAPPKK
ncbi:hypothetical protein ELE36_05545 [Pseudolysobacter antarcticus]|uniref:Peptidase S53 domain-containing protein n=1 Tax=Pseudolysobacter antarcticus TaxID=2511995 RepID=A0A411HH95_9GAMM|nr:S8 family serine peptidase [Pseudolysobacter antarcticus]QBB69875.1 hypothetical protein ELE36_05545 [Pseudolysobacter antarcticus]